MRNPDPGAPPRGALPPRGNLFLFDLDGTLLDSRAAVADAVAAGLSRAYRECGLPECEPDRGLIVASMGLPADEYFRRSYRADTVPPDRREEFSRAYAAAAAEEEIAALARGGTELFPGVEDALAALAARGHELMLYSNSATPYFEAVIAAHGLDRFFARTLCLEQAAAAGIAADKSRMVLAMAGAPGDRGGRSVVVVGDRVHDVEAGRGAGALTVGCRYGFGAPEEFEAADWVVDGLLELLDIEPAEASGVPK